MSPDPTKQTGSAESDLETDDDDVVLPSKDEAPEADEPEEGDAVVSEAEKPETEPELSDIPEEYREKVRKYADTRVGKAESGWTSKLQEYKQKAELLEKAQKPVVEAPPPPKEEGPPDPGDMPDPVLDPDAFRSWLKKDRDYQRYQVQQELKKASADNPALKTAQEVHQRHIRETIRQQLGATPEEMEELLQYESRFKQDPSLGIKMLLTAVRATKKQGVAKRGVEERPGLPSGNLRRPKPKPTGDAMRDTIEELRAEGITLEE